MDANDIQQAESRIHKDQACVRILEQLKACSVNGFVEADDDRALRRLLGLEDISRTLFNRCLTDLRKADRNSENKKLIQVKRISAMKSSHMGSVRPLMITIL